MTEPRVPAEVFDAREYVRDELAARGLTDAALPRVAKWWMDNPSVGMTGMIAIELSETFGTSARFWLNLAAAADARG